MISYFLVIAFLFLLFLPFLNAIRVNNLNKANNIFQILLNGGFLILAVFLLGKYVRHTNIFLAINYNLIYFVKVLLLFVLIEIVLLVLNRFIHLNSIFEITEIHRFTLKRSIQSILLSLLVLLAIFLYKASFWTTKTFGLLNPEQLIYNLKQPMEGANSSFIRSFFNGPLFVTIMVALIILPLMLSIYHVHLRLFDYLKHSYLILTIISAVLSVSLIVVAAKNINIGGFYRYFTSSSTFIEKNYVDPNKTKLTFPKNKRNLIYIYVESLESTSIDKLEGGQMSVNLLPNLTKLSDEGIHFSNSDKKFGGAMQFYGTGWTAAGMVAQTSGLPLKVPVQENKYATNYKEQKFLPGVTSINDILKKEGYNQTILMGSDATFGGRRSYFNQHGNVYIDDYQQAKKDKRIPKDYLVWWGYEDSKLFEFAKQDLTKLSEKNKPFNFTMLTANTHHIGGYAEKNMPQKYPSRYSNVISFTDTQLFEFISWLKQQPFYNNTTVIVNGDHLSMDANYYKSIPENKRHTFNLILNAAGNNTKAKTQNRTFGTYDMFPTTLAALGVKIEGNRLGIGTNLLSNKQTIAEKYGFNKVNDELSQSSKFYNDKFMYADK